MPGEPQERATAGSRQRAGALAGTSIGVVPILWNNADLPDLASPVPAETVLDEIARLGFGGTELGTNFPSGTTLRSALRERGLRLAGAYTALPCGPDGPGRDALRHARVVLASLDAAGGDVLIVALGFSDGRVERAGRASAAGTPALSDEGWRSLAGTLETLARDARDSGHRLCFHNHSGTYVETAEEVERLASETDPGLVRLCLDVGHYTVGGGDPVSAIAAYGERVAHVHLKDVDRAVLGRLRSGEIRGFHEALRQRIFTELGNGVLDLRGILRALARAGYRGWLMVEQDTSWLPPSESAAVGRRALEEALRLVVTASRAGREPASTVESRTGG